MFCREIEEDLRSKMKNKIIQNEVQKGKIDKKQVYYIRIKTKKYKYCTK